MNVLPSRRFRAFLLPAALYLVTSLVCTRLPLVNYLGFEFSFVIAVAGSLIAGISTILFLRSLKREEEEQDGAPDLRKRFGEILRFNFLLLVIPLVVSITNALFVRNCSFTEGFAFFLLLPAISIWFSSGLAFFCTVHYRHPAIVFLSAFAASLLYALGEGYFTPAVYSYNFFYGYFPGVTYDELLELSWSLVAFRLFTVSLGFILWRLGVILLENAADRSTVGKGIDLVRSLFKRGRRGVTLGVVVVCGVLWLLRGTLGWESPASFIRSELGSMVETEHFSIYYSPEAYPGDEIDWIAAEHEYRLAQVLDSLHLQRQGIIESYLYPSVELKRRFIGTGTSNIAKPWSGQIHIYGGDLQEVLKHELVHVAAAPFGMPVIRANLSQGLTEGLAMALDGSWGNRTIHEYAAAMKRFGVWPDMEAVMGSLGFVTQESSVSYVLAGSFLRFLIDGYGIRSVTRLYRSDDYEEACGAPLHELLAAWESKLDSVALDEGARDIVSVYFRRPPIFRKVCPRVVARRLVHARTMLEARQYEGASADYLDAYRDGGSVTALGGFLLSELRQDSTRPIYEALDTVMLRDESPERFLPLFLTVGDAYWMDGNIASAQELYARVGCSDFSDAYTEASMIRSLAAADTLAGTGLRSYLLSVRPDSGRVGILDSILAEHPDHRLASFLRGRNLLRAGKPEAAVADLEGVSFAGVSDRLESVRLKSAGLALFRMRRFPEAQGAFRLSLSFHDTPFMEDEIHDLIDRCEWFERNGMPAKVVRETL